MSNNNVITSTVSDALSSWSPMRSTIFLSSLIYFFAVLRTQGGNVALNRSVCGLSALAEDQMKTTVLIYFWIEMFQTDLTL